MRHTPRGPLREERANLNDDQARAFHRADVPICRDRGSSPELSRVERTEATGIDRAGRTRRRTRRISSGRGDVKEEEENDGGSIEAQESLE